MKTDRLISILVVLLRRDRVQAKQLAEMFGVSVRTILRDVEAINLAGIPIVTYQGANGGISIAEGYRLDKSVLSADDVAALITSINGIAANMPDHRYEILMEKLKNPLSSSQLASIDQKSRQMIIDLSPWGLHASVKAKILILRQAIAAAQEVEFTYLDASGKKTRRSVEPYSLILKGQNWYLYAWCLLRQDFRLFKLARMKDLLATNQSYAARTVPVQSAPWEGEWQSQAEMVELDLLFEPDVESLVEEWFDEDILRLENDQLMLKVRLPENDWLYAWLLSFGNTLEVINPPHIRVILAGIAQEIYHKYST